MADNERKTKGKRFWTKEYTLFAISDFIEETSSVGITFALSFFVLEYFNSVLLYSLYLTFYYVSNVVIPLVVDPLVERYDKVKINQICCFIMCLLSAVYLFLYIKNLNSIVSIIIFALLSGFVQTIFMLSKSSLVQKLVDQDNFHKASSVNNVIETSSAVSAPLATILYKQTGMKPLFLICTVLFLIGSLLCFGIKSKTSIVSDSLSYKDKTIELIKFGKENKAILFEILVLAFIFLRTGSNSTTLLPFFQDNFKNGYLWYVVITGLNSTGMVHASFLLYLVKIKRNNRYKWFMISSLLVGLAGIGVLNYNKILAMMFIYISGVAYGISNNLRLTIAYEKIETNDLPKYFSLYTALTNTGQVFGILLAGIISESISLIVANVCICTATVLGVFFVIRAKKLRDIFI